MTTTTNNQIRIHCRLTKVDEEKRLVYGRATEECVDRAGEVFDYKSSKPYFEQWSAECFRDSGGKSYGNLRAMHGSTAAGRLESIEFLDDDKAIDVAAKVVDDNEWKKVLEGVYTGFSVGGQYKEKWKDKFEGKQVNRFTAMPAELSLVDRPCVPTAKFFDIQKADGSVVRKEFVAPATATTGIASYGSKRKKRKKAVKKALEALDCMKGMGAVAGLAGLIAQLRSVYENAKAENVAEDNDASAVPAKLRSAVQVLSAVLAEMAVEESSELSDDKNELDFAYLPYRASADAGDLQKSVAGFLGLAKVTGLEAPQLATLQSLHDTACKMGAACSQSSEDTQMADANNTPLTKADVESVVGSAIAKAFEGLGLTKDELSGEGAKRGTGVKMGVQGNESHNAENSPKDGKMSPTERASNKWDDEEMDKACEMDSDEEWEEKKAKKAASKKSWDKWEEKRAASKRAKKGDFLTKADVGELVAETVSGVLVALLGSSGQQQQGMGKGAPALFAVDKDGDGLSKADGGKQAEVPQIMKGGKVDEGATELLKVWQGGPCGFVSARGNHH